LWGLFGLWCMKLTWGGCLSVLLDAFHVMLWSFMSYYTFLSSCLNVAVFASFIACFNWLAATNDFTKVKPPLLLCYCCACDISCLPSKRWTLPCPCFHTWAGCVWCFHGCHETITSFHYAPGQGPMKCFNMRLSISPVFITLMLQSIFTACQCSLCSQFQDEMKWSMMTTLMNALLKLTLSWCAQLVCYM
jgi:hypothetical protein